MQFGGQGLKKTSLINCYLGTQSDKMMYYIELHRVEIYLTMSFANSVEALSY